MKSGSEAAARILDLKDRPTALFCFNDEMAIGAIQKLTGLGLRVPQDISVSGFDDIPFSAYANPALTTIYQPAEEMGAVAMKLLDQRLCGETEIKTVTLPTELRVRQTTAPPGAA